MWCTEGGMDIIKNTGKDLVDSFDFDPASVRFYSDTIMRDGDTAFSMMMGMGIRHRAIDFDLDLFQPHNSEVDPCILPSSEVAAKERRARFDVVPFPWDYKAALAEMQDIIGVGPAGRLEDIDGPGAGVVVDAEGVPTGGVKVMTEFGQVLLYAYASGLPFLNATDEQINKFIGWQYWDRSVSEIQSQVATKNAPLLHRILDDLKTGSGTPVYVGHDTNIDGMAALLSLKWDTQPYTPTSAEGKLLPTPPGSGLLFEYEDGVGEDQGTVKLTYVYRVFNNTGDFKLSRSDIATYGSISEFEEAVHAGLKKFEGAEECFNKRKAFVV